MSKPDTDYIVEFMLYQKVTELEIPKLRRFVQALCGTSVDEDKGEIISLALRCGEIETVAKFLGYNSRDLIDEFKNIWRSHE